VSPAAVPEVESGAGRAFRCRRERLREPAVLAGHVIRDDVDDDAHPTAVRIGDQLPRVVERAVHRIDGPRVSDVIAGIVLR
jgi:hypothetical protein